MQRGKQGSTMKKPRTTDVEHLWVTDVSDSKLLNVLDSVDLAEPCYVSEETKEALLAAISNLQSCRNNFAEVLSSVSNFIIFTTNR